MTAGVSPNEAFTIRFHRTVTDVGLANSTCKAEVLVQNDTTFSAKVEPEALTFTSLNKKKSFDVLIAGQSLPEKSMEFVSLVWFDGIHRVRSPIIVQTIVLPG